jgi:hypothetical protein
MIHMGRRRAFEPAISRPAEEVLDEPKPRDTLRYIADISGELALLAGAARLPMLTYFLNMARVEAEMQINDLANARPADQSPARSRRRA